MEIGDSPALLSLKPTDIDIGLHPSIFNDDLQMLRQKFIIIEGAYFGEWVAWMAN